MVANCDHLDKLKFSKTLPFFTEDGAIQAANVMNSEHAVEIGRYVVRAFVRLREVRLFDLRLICASAVARILSIATTVFYRDCAALACYLTKGVARVCSALARNL